MTKKKEEMKEFRKERSQEWNKEKVCNIKETYKK